MFNRFRSQESLVSSRLYDERSFYKAMSTDLKAAQSNIRIESPFITVKRAGELSRLLKNVILRSVNVEVHTRNPSHHDGNLQDQSVHGIQILKEAGVKVIIHNDMRHMKVAIIDNRILWEGSLNMLSHSNSREVVRRSVSVEMCKEMLQCLI